MQRSMYLPRRFFTFTAILDCLNTVPRCDFQRFIICRIAALPDHETGLTPGPTLKKSALRLIMDIREQYAGQDMHSTTRCATAADAENPIAYLVTAPHRRSDLCSTGVEAGATMIRRSANPLISAVV